MRLVDRILAVAVLLAFGCAPAKPSSRTAVAPPLQPYQRVRFVGRVPDPTNFRYVGRVTGTAGPGGFVEAAHDARVDIKKKAVGLHASVVKIDRLRLPPVKRKGEAVLLVGRAYAPVSRSDGDEVELVRDR